MSLRELTVEELFQVSGGEGGEGGGGDNPGTGSNGGGDGNGNGASGSPSSGGYAAENGTYQTASLVTTVRDAGLGWALDKGFDAFNNVSNPGPMPNPSGGYTPAGDYGGYGYSGSEGN